MTIKETLIRYSNMLRNSGFESADLDIEVLLCSVLKCERIDLLNYQNEQIALDQYNKFVDLFLRRQKHEPIAYLTGEKEFCSYKFFINKNVLIPRPITEELVSMVLEDISKDSVNNLNIIDVGTGSGVIIISLFNKIKYRNEMMGNIYTKDICTFYATDISGKALDVAKINAKKYDALSKIHFLRGNLKFPSDIKFNYIIANLPYLDRKSTTFENDNSKDLRYEPQIALFAKDRGYKVVKKLLKKCRKYLEKDGKIYLEVEKGQSDRIKKDFKKYRIEEFYEGRIVKIMI